MGAAPVPGGSGTAPGTIQSIRESRWWGQGYADITKLREHAARHDRAAAAAQRREAHIRTRIEKLRHVSTVLREKAEALRQRVPAVQQEIAQNERAVQLAAERTKGIVTGSHVTELQFRNQKLRQRVVDFQAKAQKLDHRAAIKTQRSAELKVKADQYLERARVEAQEAQAFRERADRLQAATESAMATAAARAPAAPAAPDPRRRA